MRRSLIAICAAGGRDGFGHAVRTTRIANALDAQGWQVTLMTSPEAIDGKGIANSAIELIHLPDLQASGNPALVYDKLTHHKDLADWMLVDSFNLDREFESSMRQVAKHIATIDGMRRPHDADLIIDPLPIDPDHSYDDPAGCRRLAGPHYLPLDPAFAKIPARAEAVVERLLVCLGGDPPKATLGAVLDAIAFSGFAGTVVLAGRNDVVDEYPFKLENHGWQSHMSEFVCGCDAAIGNSGMAAWERCAAGLPSIAFVLVDNQRKIAELLDEHKASKVIHHAPDKLPALELGGVISSFLQSPQERSLLIENGKKLCDGQGLQRLTTTLVEW